MRRIASVIGILSLAFLILLAGCYEPGGPVPEGAHPPVERDYTQQDVDQVVVMEEQVISSPLPVEWGAPTECDEIHFLRFRPADGSTLDTADASLPDPAATDAMLVMLPGVLEGANGFEYLGRQLVYAAKTQNGLNVEVWAVERRNNRLEDLYAMNYLEDEMEAGNITVAEAAQIFIGYYYLGEELNGHAFAGWYRDPDLPFLSEFGLKLDTEDVFTVIQTLVPDPETRKQKVFVGGHSMGGIMTTFFAGWDLDGDPATTDDAGYNNCAGLFGFDTIVSGGSKMLDFFYQTLPEDLRDMARDITQGIVSEEVYTTFLDSLRTDPNSNRILPFPMIDAEAMTLLEAIAFIADYEPDAECTVVREVPFSDSMRILLRFIFSRDLQTYMDGTPQLTDFRLTNEAMLGVVFDDSFVPVSMIQNSMGFLEGGAVIAKDFPVSESLVDIPILGDMLGTFFGRGRYFVANDAGPSATELGQGPLYGWVNFDEVGDASDPDFTDTTGETVYTTMENEVADIQDVARLIYEGPTNLVEWYFSLRLVVDFMAALNNYGTDYGLYFFYDDELEALPKIEFIAGQGMMGDSMGDPPPNCERLLLEGYNHMDVLTASANTTARRPNGVIGPLIDFIVGNL